MRHAVAIAKMDSEIDIQDLGPYELPKSDPPLPVDTNRYYICEKGM